MGGTIHWLFEYGLGSILFIIGIWQFFTAKNQNAHFVGGLSVIGSGLLLLLPEAEQIDEWLFNIGWFATILITAAAGTAVLYATTRVIAMQSGKWQELKLVGIMFLILLVAAMSLI